MTEHALADLLAADLSGLDLVALMIDGVHFADHLCVVALGIDIDGTKHPWRWSRDRRRTPPWSAGLLVGLRERGLDVTRPILAVLDGAKALAAAVKEVFDQPVIARCQIHKLRNVRDHLPEKMRGPVAKRMRAAYHADSALEAQALLEALAKELDKTHPGAAGSLREGLAETLTVLRLDVPPTLARTLRSTNAIESMIGICRDHARNVKRWRDGQMALRWCAAGMVEASKPVPPRERPPPPRRSPSLAGTACRRRNCRSRLQHSRRERSLMLTGPPPKFHGTRDILRVGST